MDWTLIIVLNIVFHLIKVSILIISDNCSYFILFYYVRIKTLLSYLDNMKRVNVGGDLLLLVALRLSIQSDLSLKVKTKNSLEDSEEDRRAHGG